MALTGRTPCHNRLQEASGARLSTVAEAIAFVGNVDTQWKLAISFTELCASAIDEAEYMMKLCGVGDWRCDVAAEVIALWEQSLLAEGCAMPSAELLVKVKALSNFGGDYLCDESDMGTLSEAFEQQHKDVAEALVQAAAPVATAQQDVIVIELCIDYKHLKYHAVNRYCCKTFHTMKHLK
jgi:hypothetical protein